MLFRSAKSQSYIINLLDSIIFKDFKFRSFNFQHNFSMSLYNSQVFSLMMVKIIALLIFLFESTL